MTKILFSLLLMFPLLSIAAEFDSAFGVKFDKPYKGNTYTGNKIIISPEIKAENIFDEYAIVLNSKNLVEGIFATGYAHGKRNSCQESMFGLSERFYTKYKDSFNKKVDVNSVDFFNDKYIVSFMCFENTVIFSAIKQ